MPSDTEPQPNRNPPSSRMQYSVEMNTDIENIQLSVQETLDELFSEHLLPFKLTAYGVKADGLGEYVVPFHDSRIHSMTFSWKDGRSLKEVVRAAVLDRLASHRKQVSQRPTILAAI